MEVKLYGRDHLIYLALCVVVFAAVILVTQLIAKTEKQKTIVIKSVAGALLFMIVFNRISLAVWKENALELLPNTYCGMTSLLLALFALFGKPNNKAFHFFIYVEIVGGVATTFYSNFLNQGPSFWFVPTLTGMAHHALGLLLCVLLIICRWFTPALSQWKMYPIGVSVYTLYGLFLLDVLGIPATMHIDSPILPNTPLYWWFVLIVGSAGMFVGLFIFELIKKRVTSRKHGKEQTPPERNDLSA